MSARLSKTFGFYTGLVYEGRFMVNHHTVDLKLLTVSDSNDEQNTAYERMKYWVHHVLDDSILIGQEDPDLDKWLATNSRLLVLPDDPCDQIVGIMLYLKLNAIMENRMVVTDTEIWSNQGDQMSYLHTVGENIGPNLGQDGWWVDPRPVWSTVKAKDQGKVINLDRATEWKDFNLGWQSQDESKKNDSVVFADFGKNEDQ